MYINAFDVSFFAVNGHKIYAIRPSVVALRKEGDSIITNTAFPLHENARLRMQEKTNRHDQQ